MNEHEISITRKQSNTNYILVGVIFGLAEDVTDEDA